MTTQNQKYCLLVPHYNHFDQFSSFLPRLLETGIAIVVVDDGSDAFTKDRLRALIFEQAQFELIEHQRNQGKGGAIKTGMLAAIRSGFTHAVQIDADGQHDPSDVKKFIEYSVANPEQIVSGAPVFASDAPKIRLYGRKVTNFWVTLETWSLSFRDSLCGFRVYPLDPLQNVLNDSKLGSRMDFDTEVLVKSVWHGLQIHFIETQVIYHPNAVSHFKYLQDNLGLIWLHLRLMFGMLFRLPKLLWWRLNGRDASV